MLNNKSAPFSSLNIKDVLIVILLIGFVSIFGYLYANNLARNKLWINTYPIRANLSLTNLSCSENAPNWMADVLRYKTKNNNAPSNQIAYIDVQGTLHHCENGYINKYPLLSGAVTPDTRFRYASVTKLWTTDTTLDLVKQGKINLNDKLSQYITEIHNPQDARINDITIEQLLLHRAGFDRTSVFGSDMFGIGQPICPNNFERLNEIELSFTPNEHMSYSNLGYCLLGEAISRVENAPYVEVVSKKYDFTDTTLNFINNERKGDEVFYNHVETKLTGLGDIYKAFDYTDLASAAGLSGNAIDLVGQVNIMVDKPEPNITTLDKPMNCDITMLRDCYSYAMFPYQAKTTDNIVYYRDGQLPGLTSLVAVTNQGETVSLLSNGVPKQGETDTDHIKMMIYSYLNP